MTRMHVDELELDEVLARRLLAEQFPEWSELPLRRVRPDGTVNAIFRLGDELAVRLPRRRGPTEPGGRELEWLPRLAPLLPVEIPVPVAQGRPSDDYPWFWEIHTWVEGETVPVKEIDAIKAARDLAELIAALQRIDLAGAPLGRGIPLAERAEHMPWWFDRFKGDPRARTEWERIVATVPPWDGSPVWHHGDLDVRNWLVRERRIRGVIDWGAMGVGDPACDVMVAWKLHSAAARDAFREALPVDDATWERARGWAISQAVAALAYYTPENNPVLHSEAQRWLELALSEPERRSVITGAAQL
jgi:aminoglycoside phosphotransferase (APT) family kinase protein